MRRTRTGLTLIELLVSLLMTLVIAGALFSVFTNTFASREVVVGQGTAETSARTPIDTLADHLRDAQQYWPSGTQPTQVSQSSVIAAATTTSVTYYETNPSTNTVGSGDTVQYWLDGTDLKRTEYGATTIVMSNVNSLQFTYWKSNGNYNDSSATQISGNPVAADLPFLSQISIRASVNIDGYSRELASLVRLRNSPYKVHL